MSLSVVRIQSFVIILTGVYNASLFTNFEGKGTLFTMIPDCIQSLTIWIAEHSLTFTLDTLCFRVVAPRSPWIFLRLCLVTSRKHSLAARVKVPTVCKEILQTTVIIKRYLTALFSQTIPIFNKFKLI